MNLTAPSGFVNPLLFGIIATTVSICDAPCGRKSPNKDFISVMATCARITPVIFAPLSRFVQTVGISPEIKRANSVSAFTSRTRCLSFAILPFAHNSWRCCAESQLLIKCRRKLVWDQNSKYCHKTLWIEGNFWHWNMHQKRTELAKHLFCAQF